jgi:broad specificity phosphatase PhoE
MVQIALIRPGSTDYDVQGRIQGTLDVPLSEHGKAEVRALIEELRQKGLQVLYCSPCRSSWETGSAIADALEIRIKKVEKLHNLDQGLWQGMLIEDVKLKQPKVYRQWQEQPEIICPPGGEMLTHAQARVQTALNKILKKHSDEFVGVIAPEPLATLIQSYLAQSEMGDLWKLGASCGTWEIISVEPQRLVPSEP